MTIAMANTPAANPIHRLFPNAPAKPSYRIREAARVTGISRSAIYRAIERGELTALKTGPRTYRIPLESLRQYLDSAYYDPFL